MKKLGLEIMHAITSWFRSLKRWQRNMVLTVLILLGVFWLLVISDISDWWHWSEWQEHIRSES